MFLYWPFLYQRHYGSQYNDLSFLNVVFCRRKVNKANMIRKIKHNRAQILGEYALILILAVVVLTTMTIYVRRVLQSRMYDARKYMMSVVKSAPHNGILKMEYEPYYTQTNAITDQSQDATADLLGGGHTGIYRKIFDDVTSVESNSIQLPPVNAD